MDFTYGFIITQSCFMYYTELYPESQLAQFTHSMENLQTQ